MICCYGKSKADFKLSNAEVAVKMIKKLADGELFKINPVKKNSSDYNTCTDEAKEELRQNARPPPSLHS